MAIGLARERGVARLGSCRRWRTSPRWQRPPRYLYRIEVNEGPGGGVRILNQSPPAPFRESVRIAEQNLYTRSRELVGDRNPREHEFTVQLRAFDAPKSADHTGMPVLVALASALLGRPLKGGMAVVGGLNLGGSVEPSTTLSTWWSTRCRRARRPC